MFSFPSRVYPITDPHLSNLSPAEQIEQFTLGGASLVQIREKDTPPGEFFVRARAAVSAAHSSGTQVIINDRVDIALAVGADGVHLGQDDLPPAAARKLMGPQAI